MAIHETYFTLSRVHGLGRERYELLGEDGDRVTGSPLFEGLIEAELWLEDADIGGTVQQGVQ